MRFVPLFGNSCAPRRPNGFNAAIGPWNGFPTLGRGDDPPAIHAGAKLCAEGFLVTRIGVPRLGIFALDAGRLETLFILHFFTDFIARAAGVFIWETNEDTTHVAGVANNDRKSVLRDVCM